MLIKCGLYKCQLSAQQARHFRAFAEEKVEELVLSDHPSDVVELVCDYAKSAPLGDAALGCDFNALCDEQKFFSARMGLKQLVHCANLCLYLDFDELLAVALSRLAYCLGAGDSLTRSELKSELKSKLEIRSQMRSELVWFKPRGQMCWETYFAIKALMPSVLFKLLGEPDVGDMMRRAPRHLLYEYCADTQRLFELAVKHRSDAIAWLLERGAAWTRELIGTIVDQSLTLSYKYLHTMPTELIGEYKMLYREVVKTFKAPVRMDVDWLVEQKDWMTIHELLQVADRQSLTWIVTDKFVLSGECAALAQDALSEELRALLPNMADPLEPPLVRYCLRKEVETPDCDMIRRLILSSNFAEVMASLTPQARRNVNYAIRGLFRSMSMPMDVYEWAMQNDLMPKTLAAAIDMIRFGSFDVFVDYFGPNAALVVITGCLAGTCLCDRQYWHCKNVYRNGKLKDEVVLPFANHPLTEFAVLLTKTSDRALERVLPRCAKTMCRSDYLLVAARHFAVKYYEAIAPEPEPKPKKGTISVQCSDSKVKIERDLHDQLSLVDKKTSLTKKQLESLRKEHSSIETPGTHEAKDMWSTACRAGHKAQCLYFGRMLALNLGLNPSALEEIVLDSATEWLEPWPGIEKMRVGPGLKRRPEFFQLAPERLRSWIRALVHEDCLPQ